MHCGKGQILRPRCGRKLRKKLRGQHVSVDELHAISYDTHTKKLMLPIQDCTSKYGYNDLETLHIPSLQICLMSVEKCRFEPLRTLTELLSHCSPLVKTIH